MFCSNSALSQAHSSAAARTQRGLPQFDRGVAPARMRHLFCGSQAFQDDTCWYQDPPHIDVGALRPSWDLVPWLQAQPRGACPVVVEGPWAVCEKASLRVRVNQNCSDVSDSETGNQKLTI